MAYDIEKEKREAIYAGHRAISSLLSAQNELNAARSWGVMDMLGGGLISTMVKRSKMSNAQRCMDQAKHDLQAFSRELKDVDMAVNLNLEMNDFLSFADWFFDGFFVDWMVQDRINTARSQVDDAIRRVRSIVERLEAY